MTMNDISGDINYKDTITRFISVETKLNINIGDIFDNRGKCSSWQRSDRYKDFRPEKIYKYNYKLECINALCHKVDYNNSQEVNVLNCWNTDAECEVLVSSTAMMKVIDIEEIDSENYYIKLEFIGFDE